MPEYDIALELARLHILRGSDFIRQLKMLTQLNIFKPVYNETDIYAAEGSHRDDMPLLLVNRLLESVGQTNHVLLNMATDYNARLLARNIVMFFNINPDAFEVLIFKGSKSILVKRKASADKDFIKKFMFAYYK
jgi:hypothetical protein